MKNGNAIAAIGCIILLSSIVIACHQRNDKNETEWKAPRKADDLKSPVQNILLAEQNGRDIYNLYCLTCHGEYGFGDGGAGASFERRPANFHQQKIRAQSDGAIFWKITHGRGNMLAYKDVLSEEQRWQVVSYVRKISVMERPLKTPTALRNDIKVEHLMAVDSFAVRILQNPVTGNLWYTTFEGNVFEIKNIDSTRPVSEKRFSAMDHGITRLQGAVFLKNKLFLCGNIDSNEHKTTRGRLVCYNLDSSTKQPAVVFNTVDYPANKTIFDHGWNALEVSPDEKYIFVNSGARTDHGEIQDNGGLYPNARDNALTAKIFRFPAEARNLYLTDDEAKLKAEGYIYAEGVRNAYDMAFDKENLFAVSNSPDYDMPEDMFWVRSQHHYGFPWIMGGIENPQQYADWKPDPETDRFIPKNAHAWRVKYFRTDSTFPKIPAGLKFSPGVQNIGPDANEYRGHSGKILDGDITGVAVSTFTAHCSPLGLCFDTKKILSKDFKGDGFVIRYSSGARSSMMSAFTKEGRDLLHLHLTYDSTSDNYFVKTVRIVDGFNEPVDAVLADNIIYVIEYGGKKGNIWKITLPKDTEQRKNIVLNKLRSKSKL